MPRASNDIVGICSYIEKDSPQNAGKMAQVLLNAIDSLEIFPHRYTVHEHRKTRQKPCTPCRRHLQPEGHGAVDAAASGRSRTGQALSAGSSGVS